MLTLLLVLCYYSCQTDEEGVKLPNRSHRESGVLGSRQTGADKWASEGEANGLHSLSNFRRKAGVIRLGVCWHSAERMQL
jgi:hypothetical protein